METNKLPAISGRIVTDSLGFRLEVQLAVIAMDGRGRHRTYECDGLVSDSAVHKIDLCADIEGAELAEVCAHEAYHLFYSIRHLITAYADGDDGLTIGCGPHILACMDESEIGECFAIVKLEGGE